MFTRTTKHSVVATHAGGEAFTVEVRGHTVRTDQPRSACGSDAGPTPLELLSGPERIETGWWDGREVLRDYFVARDERGVRLWIYRDRCEPHGWYLHGLFG